MLCSLGCALIITCMLLFCFCFACVWLSRFSFFSSLDHSFLANFLAQMCHSSTTLLTVVLFLGNTGFTLWSALSLFFLLMSFASGFFIPGLIVFGREWRGRGKMDAALLSLHSRAHPHRIFLCWHLFSFGCLLCRFTVETHSVYIFVSFTTFRLTNFSFPLRLLPQVCSFYWFSIVRGE